MRVQVDAAVNHGNSGGPAFVDGVIAGLAFSGLDSAEADNISYLIATEEIKRFLDEAKTGEIDGDSVWNVSCQTLENPALRAKLGVASDVTGVVVITQRGGPLEAWDIITKVTVNPSTTRVRSPSKAIARLRSSARSGDSCPPKRRR